MPLPRKVKAGDPIRASDWNDLIDFVRSVQVQPSSGVRVTRGTSGTTLSANKVSRSSTPAGFISFLMSLGGTPDAPTAKFGPGTVNGHLPSNIFTSIGYTGQGTEYAKLSCDTDGKAVTGLTLVIDSNPPETPPPGMGVAQDNFDVLLYVLVNGSPFRVWGPGNVNALPTEVIRTEKSSPVPGGALYDIYYSWVTSEV